MHLPTREQAGVLIVSVSGRIDHTASEESTQALEPLLVAAPGTSPLLLDFSGVDYISSAGLARADDGFPSLKGAAGCLPSPMQPMVQEAFAISRFNLIVPCYATVDLPAKPWGHERGHFLGNARLLPVALTHRDIREKIIGA
jgi:anti-sigma B factor antagonist/stage II sporulation protein AA (anti-sigma F factor antagonist)